MNKGLLGNPIFELKKIENTRINLRVNRNDFKCASWFEHESKFNLASFSKSLLKNDLLYVYFRIGFCYFTRRAKKVSFFSLLVNDCRLPAFKRPFWQGFCFYAENSQVSTHLHWKSTEIHIQIKTGFWARWQHVIGMHSNLWNRVFSASIC